MAKGYKINMAAPRKVLLGKLERAWTETNEGFLTEAFDEEITAQKWAWPNVTIRSDGSSAGSPRDVVDTEAFRNSYERQRLSPRTYLHAYRVPYAAAIINGAQLRSGAIIPPRDITQRPLEQLPTEFAHRFRSLS